MLRNSDRRVGWSVSLVRGVATYSKHLVVGWLGVASVALVLMGVILQFVPQLSPVLDIPNAAPIFPEFWVIGAAVGWWMNSRKGSFIASLVFLPALLLLISEMRGFYHFAVPGGWTAIRDNFFTSNCGGSECMAEVFGTAPFYGALAYSIAALTAAVHSRVRVGPEA